MPLKLNLRRRYSLEPLVQQTSITCMSTIKKNLDEWDAVSSLYLGTEVGFCGAELNAVDPPVALYKKASGFF